MQQKNNPTHPSSTRHKALQRSTTLNRKYVKQPNVQAAKIMETAKKRRERLAEQINQAQLKNIESRRNKNNFPANIKTDDLPSIPQFKSKSESKSNLSTIKNNTASESRTIQRIHTLNNNSYYGRTLSAPMPPQQSSLTRSIQQSTSTGEAVDLSKDHFTENTLLSKSLRKKNTFFHGQRALMAAACAAIAIAGLGYFVHLNFPDISARVTALQSGFDIKYPSYTPRNYQLSSITTDKNAKVSIRFTNNKHHFTITEEKSTWDSQALLNNFVKKEWQNSYSISREQGMTIYFSGTNATWVNGGIMYKIIDNGNLDKIQLHNIIYSLQ